MNRRPFWIRRIEQAWEKRSLVWLSGVRRVGKTILAKMLPDAVHLNCDLPSVSRRLHDPESFYDSLDDPSRVLKIAADACPNLIAFRNQYPEGGNYVVSPNVKSPYERRYEEMSVMFCQVNQLPWL